MKAQTPIYVQEKKFSCDGGSEALGHPRVFLTIEKTGEIDCPYCGRHFVYQDPTIRSEKAS